MKPSLIMSTILMIAPALVMAKIPLKDEPRVQESMLAIGMADMIRNECEMINARMFRAFGYLRSIENYARQQGYGAAEIQQYIKDDAEKNRLYGIAHARFLQKGLNPEDPNSYCTVGLAEIAADSPIGRLLKAK
ncbi:MAG: DUF5333 domain-containing protein [Pseudomonadota bacterium]